MNSQKRFLLHFLSLPLTFIWLFLASNNGIFVKEKKASKWSFSYHLCMYVLQDICGQPKKKIMMKTNWPKNSIIGKIKQKVFLLVDAIFCPPMANYKKVHLEEGFVVTENSVNSKSFVSKSDIFPTFFIPNAFTAGRIPNFGQDHEWQGPLAVVQFIAKLSVQFDYKKNTIADSAYNLTHFIFWKICNNLIE